MPRSETILSVFIASPSDVSEERDRVDDVVSQLNTMHAKRTGIRLEVLRWERDVTPAAGTDPQAVINDQISQDYDVFLGIFWHRMGSPTARSESGAVEEYEMAKERFDQNRDSVRLMLYFKDASPAKMDEIDPDQLKKVRNFRSRVESEVFYRKFVGADDFANSISLDLTNLIYNAASDLERSVGADGQQHPVGDSGDDVTVGLFEDEEEEGYLELSQAFEEEMDSLTSTLVRMADWVNDVGGNIHQRADEMTALQASVSGKNLSKNARQRFRADTLQVMRQSSKDMDVFVKRMQQDTRLFQRHLDKGINVFTQMVPIYLELNDGEDKDGLKHITETNLEAMKGMLARMETLRDTVEGLPRMATSVNRSKRNTLTVLQEVVDVTRGGIASLNVVLSMLP